MKVTEYFVGFGPTLWSIRRGETEYGIKAIPAGGYVKIPGMTNLEEIDPADEARTYRQQPFRNRILVACAGSFMHFVMALRPGLGGGGGLRGALGQQGGRSPASPPGPATPRRPPRPPGCDPGDVVVGVNGARLTRRQPVRHRPSRGRPDTPVELDRRARWPDRPAHRDPGPRPLRGHQGRDPGQAGPGKLTGIIGVSLGTAFSAEGPLRAVGTAVTTWATTRPPRWPASARSSPPTASPTSSPR